MNKDIFITQKEFERDFGYGYATITSLEPSNVKKLRKSLERVMHLLHGQQKDHAFTKSDIAAIECVDEFLAQLKGVTK